MKIREYIQLLTKVHPPPQTEHDKQMATDLQLTTAEKTFTGVICGIDSLSGIGSLALSIYMLITADVGVGAGLGVTVATAAGPYILTCLLALSAVLTLPTAYYYYGRYLETAHDLLAQIAQASEERKILEEGIATAQNQLAQIQYACLFNQLRLYALNGIMVSADESSLLQSGFDRLKQDADLIGEIALIADKEQLSDTSHYKMLGALSSDPLPAKAPSVLPARNQQPIKEGILWFLLSTSSILGTSWSLASLIMGSITALAIATPLIGCAILAGSLVAGAAIGLSVYYFGRKNVRRETKKDHVVTENEQLKNQYIHLHNTCNQLRKYRATLKLALNEQSHSEEASICKQKKKLAQWECKHPTMNRFFSLSTATSESTPLSAHPLTVRPGQLVKEPDSRD